MTLSSAAWSGRATRAEIDLDALGGNVRALLGALPIGTELMAVVKANAYGHGAVPVSRAVLAAGATRLAVATLGEARQLRTAGIVAPILVLAPVDPAESAPAIALNVELSIATEELFDAVAGAARSLGKVARVHIKVDTGLRRSGASPELALALGRRSAALETVELAGLFTHFAAADEIDQAFTNWQSEQFRLTLERFHDEDIYPECWHQANSAALLNHIAVDGGLARSGIALYGIQPSAAIPLLPGMRPVLTLRSRIQNLLALETGDSVGYGRTYTARTVERAALVPIGYADGYPRALSNRGWMFVNGARAEVIGRVSMDQCVIRLPNRMSVRHGDEVVAVGEPTAGAPAATEIAALADSIPYELLAGIAPRVPRVYLKEGRVVGTEEFGAYTERD